MWLPVAPPSCAGAPERSVLGDQLLASGDRSDLGLAKREDIRFAPDVGAKLRNRPEQLGRQIGIDVRNKPVDRTDRTLRLRLQVVEFPRFACCRPAKDELERHTEVASDLLKGQQCHDGLIQIVQLGAAFLRRLAGEMRMRCSCEILLRRSAKRGSQMRSNSRCAEKVTSTSLLRLVSADTFSKAVFCSNARLPLRDEMSSRIASTTADQSAR